MGDEMTKEEFTLKRLKEDSTLYRWLFPIYVAIIVAFIAMSIAGFVMGKQPISLGGGLIMLSIALAAPSIMQHRFDAASAVEEYEAFLADPDRDETTLSETTLRAIRTTPLSSKELLQQWVAYGIIGVLLIGCFVFLFIVIREEPILLLVCSVLPVMGVILLFLAVRAYQSWKIAKSFE